MSPAVTVAAPAKINLYLHVTGRRADGYHTLESLMAFVGLADAVTAEPAPDGEFSLALDGPMAGAIAAVGDDNLVLRAARALADASGLRAGARLALTKRIPVAAGLAGGSADAAAALLALARLWGVSATVDLAALGLSLGADVPVCLAARPMLVAGIGEVLSPAAPMPDCGVVLVNPGVALDTATVFRAFDIATVSRAFGATEAAGAILPAARGPFGGAGDLAAAIAPRRNDLTDAARALAPAVGDVLAALGALPGCRAARMSGSGATCFALFDDQATAAAARGEIARQRPDWWSWAGGFAGR